MNLFELLYDSFKFDKNKPIRLFEAFSGIGTQHMALKRLGNEFGFNLELVGTSDWWIAANITYNSIHTKVTIVNNNDMVFNREEIIDKLLSMGFSPDDKKLATKRWYERKNDEWLKNFLKILEENKSYGAIGTFERFPKDIDVATWSFPCQDISLAGEQKGMVDGSRSNYGYVFLDTIENTPYEERPKVLLMENVKALLSEKFRDDWREIQLRLEKLGYKNYADSLIATDYGVPQTRDRVFIISILGNYNYNFPKPIKLETVLNDFLEEEVDENYYLSEKTLATFLSKGTGKCQRRKRFLSNIFRKNQHIANTITTRAGSGPTDNFIIEDYEIANELYDKHGEKAFIDYILMPEATKKGFTKARLGDGVYIDRPHQKRGVVQRNKIQTIKTSPNDIGVVVMKNKTNLGIRKLTPLEAWRLMGIKDEDFHKAKATGMSDTQLYKQAGNAIVVDVLVAIFREMLK